MLLREDIVRISESIIKELRLKLSDESNDNKKIIELKYKDQTIDRVVVDISHDHER